MEQINEVNLKLNKFKRIFKKYSQPINNENIIDKLTQILQYTPYGQQVLKDYSNINIPKFISNYKLLQKNIRLKGQPYVLEIAQGQFDSLFKLPPELISKNNLEEIFSPSFFICYDQIYSIYFDLTVRFNNLTYYYMKEQDKQMYNLQLKYDNHWYMCTHYNKSEKSIYVDAKSVYKILLELNHITNYKTKNNELSREEFAKNITDRLDQTVKQKGVCIDLLLILFYYTDLSFIINQYELYSCFNQFLTIYDEGFDTNKNCALFIAKLFYNIILRIQLYESFIPIKQQHKHNCCICKRKYNQFSLKESWGTTKFLDLCPSHNSDHIICVNCFEKYFISQLEKSYENYHHITCPMCKQIYTQQIIKLDHTVSYFSNDWFKYIKFNLYEEIEKMYLSENSSKDLSKDILIVPPKYIYQCNVHEFMKNIIKDKGILSDRNTFLLQEYKNYPNNKRLLLTSLFTYYEVYMVHIIKDLNDQKSSEKYSKEYSKENSKELEDSF